MFKIAKLSTDSEDPRILRFISELEGMKFDVTVKDSNSRQLDSDIDARVTETIAQNYIVSTEKHERIVKAEGERVGELDIVFTDEQSVSYYLEIEKTNKKTLWFDYIKLLTCLSEDSDGLGIVICPTNYAHKLGVWSLYKEALVYKQHLMRVFKDSELDRVAVVGYTQYALIGDEWVEYDSKIVQQLKNS